MQSLLLISMPGPVITGVIFLTLVVVLYSVAKAIMRWLERQRTRQDEN